MERNWYVICTKNKKERKVIAALSKKGIESFCPFTIKETRNVSRTAKEYGPLFTSFVFVNISAGELNGIRKMAYVTNPLYWKSAPAVISPDEINAIKMMTENYNCIALEKMAVNTTDKISIIEKNITAINNKIISVKHQGISIKLPTLGYCLSAERAKEKTMEQAIKKQTAAESIAQRLSALFF